VIAWLSLPSWKSVWPSLMNDYGLRVVVGVGTNGEGMAGTTTWFTYNKPKMTAARKKIRSGLERFLRRRLRFHLLPFKYIF